ncbi:MAG: RagB/SusD family nutrient uptake outer membrane protein [Bacteroidales bacterium]|nr:RagB/SusD family nutrient uptake outer membrane protein [Bacteroidales bacterium]MCI2122316.1 RagB/SusD family nutrient uptake outer membrane protein [Bacteroidales bacterium]MCI2145293.1 RagB/SusD family nutrient uptake outer membrane protein [Bacteroidales bacterium]
MALAVATSCSNLLESETKSSFDESVVFSNYTLAEYNVYSISEVFGHTNCYRGRYLPWYGFNNDTEWYNSTTGNQANLDLAQYSITSNNTNMNLTNGPYNEMYVGIERANLCIKGLRTYGNCGTDPDMAYLLGEALTMRAMIYFDLIKGWGDVPARFEPVTSSTIYVAKSSRDVIYEQILADLEESFNYLAWPNERTETETTDNVSLAFAKGLYARICIAASGYALRPDDGEVGTGNIGSVRLSSDENLSKDVLYPKALTALKDVMTSKTVSLDADFKDIWTDMNNMDLTAGKEVIFSIPFGDARGRWNYTFAVRSEGSTYSAGKTSGGAAGPVPTLYFDYDSKDVRRDISCVNYKWDKTSTPVLAGIDSWYFGKYRFEWMTVHPYSGGNDDGIKPVYMRYADILLMAAEIANYEDDMTDAKDYLLQVRKRAFKGNESVAEAYVDAISSKEGMQTAIEEERKLEFAGEFLRKEDLIRWNELKSSMDNEEEKMTELSNMTGDYSYLSGNVYYKVAADGLSLQIYGLDKTETGDPGEGWTLESDYVSPDNLDADKISSMYAVNPDTREFWPIFDASITNSQGYLVNDYGY